jgi:glucose/arabinose dehydrogenase
VGQYHFVQRLRWLGSLLVFGGSVAALLAAGGCNSGPSLLPKSMQLTIDRHITEYPDGYDLKPYVVDLDSPEGFCFDESGNMIIAEGGIDGSEPHIFAIRPDRHTFDIYPLGTRIPVFKPGFHIYGPIGGIVAYRGKIYVSHRDDSDMGAVTAFDYNGDHKTIVAGLPAQGDFGVTDLAISPIDNRLYFGVGAATNSGVVGLDNWEEGWVRDHRQACDMPWQTLNLLGYRFDADNPESSIFSPGSLVTVPFEPLGVSNIIQIPGVDFPVQKPSGCILSVALDGGDPKVYAWGVRNPAGLAADEYGSIYVTDQGMELRGTRPIDNDPDALFQINSPGSWLGWPDYSRSLEPVNLAKYQPPKWMVIPTGYPNVRFVIDHDASNLRPPSAKDMLKSLFPWQSGASKMAFFPKFGPFHQPRYEGELLVALWGDRAPFSTSGRPMQTPLPGYRIVRVDPNSPNGEVSNFIYNTRGGPGSLSSDSDGVGLERPIDVKFGPDGNLYILDFGKAWTKHGQLKTEGGTGKVFICLPASRSMTPQ